jgi:hypothetical protein
VCGDNKTATIKFTITLAVAHLSSDSKSCGFFFGVMLITLLGATFAFAFPLTLLVECTTITSVLLISQFWFHLHDKKRISASTHMKIINALSQRGCSFICSTLDEFLLPIVLLVERRQSSAGRAGGAELDLGFVSMQVWSSR